MAEQGDAVAQTALGAMYAMELGVRKNYRQATKLFRLAAEQGNFYAQYNLGTNYRLGRGVTKDYVKAHKWFSLADSISAFQLRGAGDSRDYVASKMTPAEIAEAERLARDWLRKR